MRVIFNGLPAYSPKTGVGIYVANLLEELRQIAGEDAVAAFPSGISALAAGIGGKLRAIKQRKAASGGGSGGRSVKRRAAGLARSAVQHVYARSFARMCRRGKFDLYHEPNFIPWECDLPTVITVHDLSVVLHPEWHPRDRVKFHERHFQRSLERCAHVLTVSECMRRDLIAAMGFSPSKVTAVANGVRADLRQLTASDLAPVRAKLGLPADYLLYVGTIEPRKNILTLLRAYSALNSRTRLLCPLVLAGGWGWGYAKERAYFEDEARHRSVIHLGYVADDDLPALYSGATALVYPSHYEGFGLPPVEMMACGGAVLASTAPALREVCGNRAHFIDPNNDTGWRDAMRRVIEDADWRAELRTGVVKHAQQYSWRRCADEIWQVYESIAHPESRSRAA